MPRRRALLALVAIAAVATGACNGERTDDGDERSDDVVEVFTNYRDRDADVFRRVLDEFEALSGYDVVHVGTADFARRIQERVDEREVPDVALFPQPGLVRDLAGDGQILTLESFSETSAEDVRQRFPAILEPLIVDGELLALPWRVDVGSLVWYRPAVFEELGYRVPESFFDLQALVSQMQVDGYTPWCLAIESFDATGWVGTDWIEDILLRTQPLDVYDEWATGEIAFADERIREALRTWNDLALEPGRHFGTTRTILNTSWTAAADPLFDDVPGCLLHRQLGGAYRDELPAGTTIGPTADVDVFVMPAADVGEPAPVLLAGEFAAAMTPKPGVEELLLYLADPTAGEVWAAAGGYISPHLEFDVGAYSDPFGRRLADVILDSEILRFDGSDTMPPDVGVGTFWDGVVEFVSTRDLDSAVATIDAGFSPG